MSQVILCRKRDFVMTFNICHQDIDSAYKSIKLAVLIEFAFMIGLAIELQCILNYSWCLNLIITHKLHRNRRRF